MPPCAICNERDQRYKCPACQAPYCSVACFKSHKGTLTSLPPNSSTDRLSRFLKVRCASSPSGPSTTPLLDVPAPTTIPLPTRARWNGITRSLDDIKVPEEREEDRGLWDDPLRVGEVKPLRTDDYLRLAKSQPLRQILSPPDPTLPPYAHPQTHLRQLLTAIAGIKNLKEREEVLSRCLGLDSQGGASRIGGHGKGGKRGGKMESHARGEGFYIPNPQTQPNDSKPTDINPPTSNPSTPTPSTKPPTTPSKGQYIGAQEQATMREFAELVQRVLERDEEGETEGRGVKRKVEWGV